MANPLRAISYKELDLNLPWQSFDIAHQLTKVDIQKFVTDYRSTLKRSAECTVRGMPLENQREKQLKSAGFVREMTKKRRVEPLAFGLRSDHAQNGS